MNVKDQTHPSRDELAAYLAGKLNAVESDNIKQHLAACETCCDLVDSLPTDDTIVAALRQQEAETSVSTDVDSANVIAPTITPEADEGTQAVHGQKTRVAGLDADQLKLPPELRDHPRYKIVELLGHGGMGDVYRAEHKVMSRPVALKVIKPQLVQNDAAVRRFQREVKAAARLHHPNIVTAYDAEQAGNLHYLVMEFVEGEDLDEVIHERGALPVDEACEYIRQAAEGLQHAHELGMVHRDIKPHNLMVAGMRNAERGMGNEEGDSAFRIPNSALLKILDFGLANFANEVAEDELHHADDSGDAGQQSVESHVPGASILHQLTQMGTMMGTPDYIAPEQAEDAHTADIRSDIYSLGCTFYTLLSGKAPFGEGSVMDKVRAHTEQDAPPLSEFRDDVPEEVEAVLLKMMAKEPAERYQTPAEVAEALAQCSPNAPRSDKRISEKRVSESPAYRKRRPLMLTAVATLFLALLAAAATIFYIQTNNGVVRVEVTDPSLKVSIAGQTITTDDNGKPLTIRAGEQKLIVRQKDSDFELVTDSFQLRRGDDIVLKVELLPGEVVVSKEDGTRLGAKALPQDQLVAEEWKRLEGRWQAIGAWSDGAIMDRRETEAFQVRVKDRTITFYEGGRADPGEVRIDPTTTPKRIDVTPPGVGSQSRSKLGIYKLEGDRWTICLPATGKPRPKVFDTGPRAEGGGAHVLVLQRVESDPVSTEWSRLAGRWQGTAFAGRTMFFSERDKPRNNELLADAETRTITLLHKGRGNPSAVDLDPTVTPKTIDMTSETGNLSKGIYKLDGDDLTICLADAGQGRPKEFHTDQKTGGGAMIVFRRLETKDAEEILVVFEIQGGKQTLDVKGPGIDLHGPYGDLRKELPALVKKHAKATFVVDVGPKFDTTSSIYRGFSGQLEMELVRAGAKIRYGPTFLAKARAAAERAKQGKEASKNEFRVVVYERNGSDFIEINGPGIQKTANDPEVLIEELLPILAKRKNPIVVLDAGERGRTPTPDEIAGMESIQRVLSTAGAAVRLDPKLSRLLVGPGEAAVAQPVLRKERSNDLKEIGRAQHSYHDDHKSFPPAKQNADHFDKEGRPHLSWRVHLLPYLEQQELYDRFHLDEPWDSEHNKPLLARMPDVFKTTDDPTRTTLLAVVGEGTGYEGKEGLNLDRDFFLDGTSNTALVVDAGRERAVPWTKPEDLPFDREDPIRAFGTSDIRALVKDELSGDVFLALMADASVQSIPYDTAPESLRALFTRADGNAINLDRLKKRTTPLPPPGEIRVMLHYPEGKRETLEVLGLGINLSGEANRTLQQLTQYLERNPDRKILVDVDKPQPDERERGVLVALQSALLKTGAQVRLADRLYGNGIVPPAHFKRNEITLVRKFDNHTARLNDVAFLPGGERGVSISGKAGEVKLWDLRTGKADWTHLLKTTNRWAGGVAVSPDGKTIAAVGGDLRVHLIDVATGESVHHWLAEERHTGDLRLAFSPDGRRLAATTGRLRLFDVKSRKEIPTGDEYSDVQAVAISPDGKYLYLGTYERDSTNGSFVVVELKAGGDGSVSMETLFSQKTGVVQCVAVSPDGQWFAYSAGQPYSRIFVFHRDDRFRHGARLVLNNPNGNERAGGTGALVLRFTPDSKHLLCGYGGTGPYIDNTLVTAWELTTQKQVFRHAEFGYALRHFALSPDGRELLSLGNAEWQGDAAVRLWQLPESVWPEAPKDELKPLGQLEGHATTVIDLAWHPDGKRAVSIGSRDAEVRMWDVAERMTLWTWKPTKKVENQRDHYTIAVAISAVGKRVAVGDADGTIYLLDVENGKELKSWPAYEDGKFTHAGIAALDFSPGGELLASVGRDQGTGKVWRLKDGKQVINHTNGPDAFDIAFSQDGQAMISAGYSATYREVEEDKEGLKKIGSSGGTGHDLKPQSVAVSPRGDLYAFGYPRGEIYLYQRKERNVWSATKLSPAMRFDHAGTFVELAFTPDGRHLISGSPSLIIWSYTVEDGRFTLRPILEKKSDSDGFFNFALSPDGKTLLTIGDEDGTGGPIHIWQLPPSVWPEE